MALMDKKKTPMDPPGRGPVPGKVPVAIGVTVAVPKKDKSSTKDATDAKSASMDAPDTEPDPGDKAEAMEGETETPIEARSAGESGEDDGKSSPERAIAVKSDQHCKNCTNWEPETGNCEKVSG